MTDISAEAQKEANKWIKALSFSGEHNIPEITKILEKRTFEGKPLTAVYVAASPDEAIQKLKELYQTANEEDKLVIKQANSCIWDYYLMAYYETSCKFLPDKNFPEAEFIYQSLFPAFKAGLGFLINLGDVLIGIYLPQVYLDDQQRFHCPNGPALIWGNETQYWWHGTQVEKDWIENKESVDPSIALNHPNIEQRRALCEILGWEIILKKLSPVVIDHDKDPEIGDLLEVDLPDSNKSRFLRVQCGTGRKFTIPVPQEMKTALEANAWTYGIDDTINFIPQVRT